MIDSEWVLLLSIARPRPWFWCPFFLISNVKYSSLSFLVRWFSYSRGLVWSFWSIWAFGLVFPSRGLVWPVLEPGLSQGQSDWFSRLQLLLCSFGHSKMRGLLAYARIDKLLNSVIGQFMASRSPSPNHWLAEIVIIQTFILIINDEF